MPIFTELDDESLDVIMAMTVRRTFTKNTMIVIEQAKADTLYIIESGSVKITRLNEDGREVILALLGATVLAAAQDRPVNLLKAEIAQKVEEIYKEWDRDDGPGGVVAITLEGRIVFAKAYGMAELENSVPNTLTTKFDIASVSKQFTAMCILLLEEDGLLSLDDRADKYIRGMPVLKRGITIRQLLTHTSGIRDHLALMALVRKRTYSAGEAISMLQKQQDLNFKPGTKFMYSNSGYLLLASIVQAVSGVRLSLFAKDRIFDPLGMDDTVIVDGPSLVVPNRAVSYRRFRGRFVKAEDLTSAVGASGVNTTVYDMMKWQENFESNVLGEASPHLMDKLLTPHVLPDGEETTYGLGVYVDELAGVRRITHTGSWQGYRAVVTRFPNYDLTIMTFANDGTQNASVFNGKVSQIILETKLDKPVQDPRRSVDLGRGLLQEYVGLYKVGEGTVASVTREGRRLRIRLTGRPRRDLYADQADRFYTRDAPVQVAFKYDGEGKVNSGTISLKGKESEMLRIEQYEPTAKYLDELTGTYNSSELDIELTVEQVNGTLYLKRPGRSGRRLNFHLPDWATLGSTKLQFVRDEDGRVIELLQTMDRISNLRFVRKNP
ncbi:MAG: serine hydrolase [Armatimonadetes bacterium]|nr:serine hydrolase [Armatimonadota bacterium]